MGVFPTPLLDRIADKVDFDGDDGCWNWTASRNPAGYGQVDQRSSHRALWEVVVGPVPDGLELDHLCGNKSCVNPDHLEPVTHLENMRRRPQPDLSAFYASQRARSHCKNGHEWTPENTWFDQRDGSRGCRTCRREATRRYQARRREG